MRVRLATQTILVVGVLVGTVVVLGVVGLLLTRLEQKPERRVDEELVLGGARLATGSAEARVTIVEFSDFQCPACRAAQPAVKQILRDYPEEVRLVYRHFPLTQIHKNAMAAAEAAEAAAAEGRFWQMHDTLFERQSEWSEEADVGGRLAAYGQELGLNLGVLMQAVTGEVYKNKIEQDVRDGQRLGVNATPTFFVNGRKANSVQLRAIVEEELQK